MRNAAMTAGHVLVLTVGTGNMERLEESLLKPLAKSIGNGNWSRAVLLPSMVTEEFAQQVVKRFPDLQIQIEALRRPNMENDADACFEHFDKVLDDLLAAGFGPEAITVDFTRGTKAMSAALVLAAARRDIPRLRYVWGERDRRGMVTAGKERIGELRTTRATWRRRLDAAASLMHHGDFAAVLELVPDSSGPFARLLTERLREEAAGLRRRANFCSAWDRLDYGGAEVFARGLRNEDRLGEAATWVKRLARMPERSDHCGMAEWLRAVACDLLANGRRRINDGHFEDALLRGYRVLELVGQFRLFDLGYDSASIDQNDKAVRNLRRCLKRNGSHDFGQRRDGRLKAPRELAARLLKELGEPLGKRLLDFDTKHGGLDAATRNHSILIHGFEAAAPSDESSLEEQRDSLAKLYDALEALLREADPHAGEMIETLRGQRFYPCLTHDPSSPPSRGDDQETSRPACDG